jgi:hypothetical protein
VEKGLTKRVGDAKIVGKCTMRVGRSRRASQEERTMASAFFCFGMAAAFNFLNRMFGGSGPFWALSSIFGVLGLVQYMA